MRDDKTGGTAEELRKAALACVEAARTLSRPVVWDISQKWSLKLLMPPDDLLARVDELKAAAGKAAEECAKLLGPFMAKLAAMHDEPVTLGRVKASNWHEAAAKVARKAAGWHLGTSEIGAYFKSRLDPDSGKLRPTRSGAGTNIDQELHILMGTVDHDADDMEARLRIEAAKLAEMAPDTGVRLASTEAAVVAALRQRGPMRAAEIAEAVHRSPNGGSLRSELAGMKRRGIIKSGAKGYELA